MFRTLLCRQSSFSALSLCLVLAALGGQAVAQEAPQEERFQAEHFEPLPSQGLNILNIGSSRILGSLDPSIGLFFHYINSPVTIVNQDDQDEVFLEVISNQVKAELTGSIGLFGFAELGFALPVVLWEEGDDLERPRHRRVGQSVYALGPSHHPEVSLS